MPHPVTPFLHQFGRKSDASSAFSPARRFRAFCLKHRTSTTPVLACERPGRPGRDSTPTTTNSYDHSALEQFGGSVRCVLCFGPCWQGEETSTLDSLDKENAWHRQLSQMVSDCFKFCVSSRTVEHCRTYNQELSHVLCLFRWSVLGRCFADLPLT